MTNYFIPLPPKDIFLNQVEAPTTHFSDTPRSVIEENPTTMIIDHIEFNNGIYVHYVGFKYPRRGYPFAEAVAQINVIKRTIIDTCMLISSKELILGWITLMISPRRMERIDKILNIFAYICYPPLTKYLVKPELMTPFSAEIQGVIFGFLAAMGISMKTSKKIAYVFGAIFEYDIAYRLRLEDLCSETTKEKLMASPIKEARRLFKIYLSREIDNTVNKVSTGRYVSDKFKSAYTLLALVLLIPKVKKAFITAIDRSEFNRLQLDEIDRYWCASRADYNFEGKTFEERMMNSEMGTLHKLIL